MASIILNAAERAGVTRVSESSQLQVRGTRDGAMFVADWYEAHALEGRVFNAGFGSVTTVLTFLITLANRPDFWIRCPDGTMILPLVETIALEAYLGTDTEIDIRDAQNDIGNGTSTAATVAPQNMRSDAPVSSNCTARQLATGDTTAETNPKTLWRYTINTAEAAGNDNASKLTITRPMMGYPVGVGPYTWETFVAATTTQATGFGIKTWVEFAERN